MHRTKTGLCVILICCSTAISEAGWFGQTITADWYVPDNVTILESHNVVVAAGVELPFGSIANGGNLAIDLSDTQVRFEFNSLAIWSPATLNGWKFSDIPGAGPNIIGASLGPMSPGISGLTNSALSCDATSILGNFVGVTAAGAGDFYTIDIQFAPEPSSVLLAGMGLTALAAIQWRRRKQRQGT
jgi:hypothetical protein